MLEDVGSFLSDEERAKRGLFADAIERARAMQSHRDRALMIQGMPYAPPGSGGVDAIIGGANEPINPAIAFLNMSHNITPWDLFPSGTS